MCCRSEHKNSPDSDLAAVNLHGEIEEAESNVQGKSADSEESYCLNSVIAIFMHFLTCWIWFVLSSKILSLDVFLL